MTYFNAFLLMIYSEVILMGPDFFNFLAFVFFMVFITDFLGSVILDMVDSTRKSYFEVLSKSKLEQLSNLSEKLDEAALVSDAADLLSDISENSLVHPYNQVDEAYYAAEHAMSVGFITHLEAAQLNALVNSLYDLSSVVSNQLLSPENSSKKA
jgi:hypothetical protein